VRNKCTQNIGNEKLIIKLILGKKILRILSDLNLFRIEFIDMLLWW